MWILLAASLLDAQAGTPSDVAVETVDRVRQAMVGEARLPWLVLATASIKRWDGEPSSRVILEWEPCQRRLEARGSISLAADDLMEVVAGAMCSESSPKVVHREGSQVRLTFKESGFELEADSETGLVNQAKARRWVVLVPKGVTRACDRSPWVTADLSDYKRVGTTTLPHRIRLQAQCGSEEWTIERIELVPLP